MTTAFARLRRDSRGLAMIEFALALPVLLVATLGGLETANFVLANMKISQIAAMTADNASRVRTSIDESDINELMTGANLAGGNLDLEKNGRIILTDLQRNTLLGIGQWIRWQRCFGKANLASSYGKEGAGKYDLSLVQGIGPANNKVTAMLGTSVMFVEVRYNYTPLIAGLYGGSAKEIAYTAAFNVRKRPDGDPTNAGKLPSSAIAKC